MKRSGPGSWSRSVGEVEGGAEHDGGVDVVTACVRHARHLAAVGHVLLVGHRQRIEVGPQRQPEVGVPVPMRQRVVRQQIADEPGPRREAMRFEPGELEAFVDEVGGRSLFAAQFGMSVQVASQGDESFAVFVEPAVDRVGPDIAAAGGQRRHRGAVAPVIESAASSAARCWTTSSSVPPASTTRRWRCAPDPACEDAPGGRRAGRDCRGRWPPDGSSSRRSSTSERTGCRSRVAVLGMLDDQLCVDAVARRKPAILADRPLTWRWRQRALVDLPIGPFDEGLGERGERDGFAHRVGGVTHPEFDGAEIGVGADVPPHLSDRGDASGLEQRRHECLEVGPVRQRRGAARRWGALRTPSCAPTPSQSSRDSK